MLELRPTCEHCNKTLQPNSTEAMICSFECTFCRNCVETILENVCPNCGGGFTARPVRPKNNLKNDNCLEKYPASKKIIHQPVDVKYHQNFIKGIRVKSPQER